MNSYQDAVNDSNKLIVKEAEANPDAVKLIPAFGTAIEKLRSINSKVESFHIEQKKDLSGVADNKADVKETLIESALNVSGALHSYADDIGNLVLLARISFNETALRKMKNSNLIISAQIVLDEADAISADELAKQGITPEELDEFRTILITFKQVNSDPKGAIIDRSSYTQKISEQISESLALRKNQLEKLANQFKRKAPDFYLKYKSAANIVYKNGSNGKNGSTTADDTAKS